MLPISTRSTPIKELLLKVLCTWVILLSFNTLFSQHITSKSSKANLFLRHVVKAGETYNMIAIFYGITGEELASYNNLEYHEDKVLSKYLTVPLNGSNYTSGKKRVGESWVPVYRVNGSAERIIGYKNNSSRTETGLSPIYFQNKLVSRYKSTLILDGFLHTETEPTIFTTITRSDAITAPDPVLVQKRDSLKQAEIKVTSDTLQQPVAAAIVAPAPVTIIKTTPTYSSAIKSYKNPTPAFKTSSKRSRPKSRVEKIYALVKIQLVIYGSLVALVFLSMILKNKKEVLKAKTDRSLRSLLIREVVADGSFEDDEVSSTKLGEPLQKHLKKESNGQFIIDEIITGRKNLKGKVGDNFLKLYLALKLDKDAFRKLKSRNWNEVAKGIQELAMMEQHHAMSEIFNEINSKNEYVRMEAQLALVQLSGFRGLWFLNVLSYPISEWQQIRLINMLSSFPVSDIPDFQLLLTSSNQSLVIFTLKLISAFQQRGMHNEVIKCLDDKSEAIRFHAINCVKEIYNPSTAKMLVEKFAVESRRNKIAIVKVVGEICDENQTDFLLGVLALQDDTLKMCAAKALSSMGNKGNWLLENYCNSQGDPYSQIFLHIKSAV